MLIQDLEKNILAIGGRKVEYEYLVQNEELYWFCRLPCYSLERDFIDVLLKDYAPSEFFNFNTDIEVSEKWTYLFYHVPNSNKTVEEKKRKLEMRDSRFKEVLVCCVTDDGENDIYTESFIQSIYHKRKRNKSVMQYTAKKQK